jgi:uncharacterized protein (TIGR03435 family)
MRTQEIAGLAAVLIASNLWAGDGAVFEAASIHIAGPAEAGPGDIPRNMDSSPGHFAMRNVPLRYCLEWAWDLKDYEIAGPDWIQSENRYDIIASAPGAATEEQMRLMLRNLLTDRFQMKIHLESRNLDVYVLEPGKGEPKMKEATAGEQTSVGATQPRGSVKFTKQPISRFTFMLTSRLDKPTLDETGLKGLYDFTIDLSGLGFNGNPPEDTSAPSVFTTVPQDLGLRLEAAKRPVEILVIDQAEKIPTAN